MYYRKKPITIRAERWFPGKQVDGVLRMPPQRVDLSATRGILINRPERHVCNTLYGQLEISAGDWIVTGVEGEKYPVKPDIFDLTYEPVSTPGYVRQRDLRSMALTVAIVISGAIVCLLMIWALK